MNWKTLRYLVFVLLQILVVVLAEEKYSSKYDDINVDNILANSRLRNQYVNCYLGTSTCVTADARYFKGIFPEAFVTKCRKCTQKQEEFFSKITIWFTEHEPDTWRRIIEKTVENIQKKAPK
ncbi:ejaculatory bulb-specific protein 3-like [Calliopsis andreniformis]|uniref:ejaculatory bulb-specific protein 3-like n=1 Tax=Calliopsis andreniformis TaxID=337506 RepID=UPI003FCDF27E